MGHSDDCKFSPLFAEMERRRAAQKVRVERRKKMWKDRAAKAAKDKKAAKVKAQQKKAQQRAQKVAREAAKVARERREQQGGGKHWYTPARWF